MGRVKDQARGLRCVEFDIGIVLGRGRAGHDGVTTGLEGRENSRGKNVCIASRACLGAWHRFDGYLRSQIFLEPVHERHELD